MAEENGLQCGDEITFSLEEGGAQYTLPVCGIYQVDSDYDVADPTEYDYSMEDTSFDVYRYSPYNRIYASCDVIADLLGEPVGDEGTVRIFVDVYDSIDTTAAALKELVGDRCELYDRGSKYLENYGMLTMVKNLSQMLAQGVAVVGLLLTLIAMTYCAAGFQFECGLMILLGKRRSTVILRYLLFTGLLLIAAGILAGAIYLLIGSDLVQAVADAANSYTLDQNEMISFYSTALYQPFSMTASASDLLNWNALFSLLGIEALLLVGTALIPVWSVFQARPKQLLE